MVGRQALLLLLLLAATPARAQSRTVAVDAGRAWTENAWSLAVEPVALGAFTLRVAWGPSGRDANRLIADATMRVYPMAAWSGDQARRFVLFLGAGGGIARGEVAPQCDSGSVCSKLMVPATRAGPLVEAGARLQPRAGGPFLEIGARHVPDLHAYATRVLLAVGVPW